MPSTSAKLANTIHIRDFVDDVLADRTQPNKRNYFEIHTDVNIFQEDGFYDSGITVEPIHTCIRTYLTASERGLYVTNAFFYAEGRFKAAVTTENKLEITVHALGLQRHPGDVSSFDDYRRHLPEKWCPMLTVMGCVGYRNDEPIEQSGLRHFELQTSVYDPPKDAPFNFSVMCYFSDNKLWENFKVPKTGSYVSVIAKVVGRSTKGNCLAVRILDMSYIPGSFSTPVPLPASTPSTSSKREARWDGRVESATPSKGKSPWNSGVESTTPSKGKSPWNSGVESTTPSKRKSPWDDDVELTTPSKRERPWGGRVESTMPSKKVRYSAPEVQSPRTSLGQLPTISQDPPASSPIDGDLSSTSTITSQISDGGRRPQRNSRPSK